MIIKVKNTDYIVGVWMAQQVYLGEVYIYTIKEIKENQWIGYIKYIYVNQDFNMYMSDNDDKNTFTCKDISELEVIKICEDKIDELSILFCHNRKRILIGGDFLKYREISLKNKWLLPIKEVR